LKCSIKSEGGRRVATMQKPRRAGAEARQAAERGSGWYAWVARGGLVAKGLSFGIVGVLALELAVGGGGKATSREGALQSLAQHSFGKLLLILLAVGFAAYALWRFIQAYAERDEDRGEQGNAKKWSKRAGYVGRGLIYAGLTYSTIRILTSGRPQQSQNEKAHHSAGMALSWPAGRWLVGVAGLVIIGAGLWNLYRGLAKKFEDKWRTGEMSESARRWGGRAGMAGHIARFVVFGLIGVFVGKAALDYDPKAAIGLDGALQKLSQQSYGSWLLGLTAAGLVCYGIYCLVDARYRDVSTDGSGSDAGSLADGSADRRPQRQVAA
jgi:hypothetical protein